MPVLDLATGRLWLVRVPEAAGPHRPKAMRSRRLVSPAADSPPRPEGNGKSTRHSHRTRMGAPLNRRCDLPKDPRTVGVPRCTRTCLADRGSDPPRVLVGGSASGQTDNVSIENTARAETLSLTRGPASRRKRRGRGWIPRSLSLVSLGQGPPSATEVALPKPDRSPFSGAPDQGSKAHPSSVRRSERETPGAGVHRV
jgi:hypothetical protein